MEDLDLPMIPANDPSKVRRFARLEASIRLAGNVRWRGSVRRMLVDFSRSRSGDVRATVGMWEGYTASGNVVSRVMQAPTQLENFLRPKTR